MRNQPPKTPRKKTKNKKNLGQNNKKRYADKSIFMQFFLCSFYVDCEKFNKKELVWYNKRTKIFRAKWHDNRTLGKKNF